MGEGKAMRYHESTGRYDQKTRRRFRARTRARAGGGVGAGVVADVDGQKTQRPWLSCVDHHLRVRQPLPCSFMRGREKVR